MMTLNNVCLTNTDVWECISWLKTSIHFFPFAMHDHLPARQPDSQTARQPASQTASQPASQTDSQGRWRPWITVPLVFWTSSQYLLGRPGDHKNRGRRRWWTFFHSVAANGSHSATGCVCVVVSVRVCLCVWCVLYFFLPLARKAEGWHNPLFPEGVLWQLDPKWPPTGLCFQHIHQRLTVTLLIPAVQPSPLRVRYNDSLPIDNFCFQNCSIRWLKSVLGLYICLLEESGVKCVGFFKPYKILVFFLCRLFVKIFLDFSGLMGRSFVVQEWVGWELVLF